jgi:aryl carrier-like protein
LEHFASSIPPLLSDFTAPAPGRGQELAHEAELTRRIEDAPIEERWEVLLSWLRALTARVLGLPDASAADPAKPLHELGMDSLMAVEIRNIVAAAVGRALPSTLLFDYPTVEGLAAWLRREVLRIDFAELAETRTVDSARAARVAGLSQMGDDEVQELLAGKLLAWTKGKSS